MSNMIGHFTTTAKASAELCFTFPKYCKTFDTSKKDINQHKRSGEFRWIKSAQKKKKKKKKRKKWDFSRIKKIIFMQKCKFVSSGFKVTTRNKASFGTKKKPFVYFVKKVVFCDKCSVSISQTQFIVLLCFVWNVSYDKIIINPKSAFKNDFSLLDQETDAFCFVNLIGFGKSF